MRDHQGSGPTISLILGAFAVMFGSMLLLRNLGVVPRQLVMFWPLLFIVAGLVNIFLFGRGGRADVGLPTAWVRRLSWP